MNNDTIFAGRNLVIATKHNKEKVIEYRTKYCETKKQNNAIYEWLLEITKL
jgi:hypothetical protein